MLRPQVFALQEGQASIGMVASEKQAIDAILRSLSREDDRFWPVADRYWNARGGSYTNGGAFLFSLRPAGDGLRLTCTDKFGKEVGVRQQAPRLAVVRNGGEGFEKLHRRDPRKAAAEAMGLLRELDAGRVQELVDSIMRPALEDDARRSFALEVLTRLLDRPYPMEACRRSRARALLEAAIEDLLEACSPLGSGKAYERVDWDTRSRLQEPVGDAKTLVVDATDFPAEDDEGLSTFIARACRLGWRSIVAFRHRGQRFVGCGLGPESRAEIHVYGSCGDYLASGLDGSRVHVHGTAQDQVAQIMKSGRLVIHGDVGQTFMYGAKGGEAYVLGNAAGRPLINAVGRPRVVINGTALDYLAESFMAGDPFNDGGFVILNGIAVDDQGRFIDLETPYEGGNLFSLASGGALYIRDPEGEVEESQLNGGRLTELREMDWELIHPYLQANEDLLGVPLKRLLTFRGRSLRPEEAYRKVEAVPLKALIPAHD
jgi:glutamate synthase domain-containing protein 3